MTPAERSLLLFFEARAVDYWGRVNAVHMNEADFKIAERWNKSGFILFGRIRAKDITARGAHWCFLSDRAVMLAHQERLARMRRTWDKRAWRTTAEAREERSV